jgi:two-component system, OmpR family, alkaline phosphatase synthesis response regulator PhoP
MSNTILIIDIELNEYRRLKERLEQYQFKVHFFSNHQDGIYGIHHLKPDLIIYNFQLFQLSEKMLHEEKNGLLLSTPFIITSSSNHIEELLYAFQKGAADYISKPIYSRELAARVKAILRRIKMNEHPPTEKIKIGNFVVSPHDLEIDLSTHKVNLSKRELEVLLLLIERRVISREEMFRIVWCDEDPKGNRIVDVYINHLRGKIEPDPKKPQYIKTVKGFGYRFNLPKQ